MEFGAVVAEARELHSKEDERHAVIHTSISTSERHGLEEVFGRICNTSGSSPPTLLSLTPDRKTVFVFGPDSIDTIILKQNTYKCLQSFGFDQEYIYHEVVENKAKYWLVLFTKSALKGSPDCGDVVEATWEGVLEIVKTCYPDAYDDTLLHFNEICSKPVSDFEQEAGFKFLDAKKNVDGADPSLPPFHNYAHFLSLPRPKRAWQVRLFLYCELRLLSLFKGDGFTREESGRKGPKEYLCLNLQLSTLDPKHLAILPMSVSIPQ